VKLAEIFDDPHDRRIDLQSKVSEFAPMPVKESYGFFDFKVNDTKSDYLGFALVEKDTDRVESYLNLTKTQLGWQVGFMQSDTKQEGHMKFLTERAAQLVGHYFSDASQTPEARGFWQHVIQKPHLLIVRAFSTKKSYPIKQVDGKWKPNVWSDSKTWRLLIKPKIADPVTINEWARKYELAYQGVSFYHYLGHHDLDKL